MPFFAFFFIFQTVRSVQTEPKNVIVYLALPYKSLNILSLYIYIYIVSGDLYLLQQLYEFARSVYKIKLLCL